MILLKTKFSTCLQPVCVFSFVDCVASSQLLTEKNWKCHEVSVLRSTTVPQDVVKDEILNLSTACLCFWFCRPCRKFTVVD